MKTNFFKIVLPAFALMLAITASLAFTPVENNMADDANLDSWYQVDFDDQDCTPLAISEDVCNTTSTSEPACTKQQGPHLRTLFLKDPITEKCNVILYKAPIVP